MKALFCCPASGGGRSTDSAVGGARGPQGAPVLRPARQPRTVRHPIGVGLAVTHQKT